MKLRNPIPGYPTTARFGWRQSVAGLPAGLHNGHDWGAPSGTPVYAAADGVAYRRWEAGGFGNYVYMTHGSGHETFYAHLSGFAVADGTRVKAGQLIGYVGSTGASTGPHLHFSYRRNGTWVNPIGYIHTPSSGSGSYKGDMDIMAADFFMRRNSQSKVYAIELMGGKEGKPAWRPVSSLEWTVYQRAMRAAGRGVPVTNEGPAAMRSLIGREK